ncbi:hypothetical protein CPB83DRAFT_909021 [Crepidotus variabilis]|uniref:Uncharacterized protein n=1 Tax=Crepidotus variabilis TaxID=179855 RepID=A0A9P6JLV8_9AGAR|nr:hypothetical protein CPB83DRAFT_909021 [Crepidotus variabilis]
MADTETQANDILEAALDDAFSSPPSQAIQPDILQSEEALHVLGVPPQPVDLQGVPPAPPADDLSSSSTDETWKEDYETQLNSWRAQNAEQRAKAERERSKWEAIRAQEKEEAKKRKAAGIVDEPSAVPTGPHSGGESWEKVGAGGLSTVASSQLIDFDSGSQHPNPESHATTEELHKWEDVDPSISSSFPSLSMDTPPQPSQPRPESSGAHPPVSVTLSIFDTSLSTRTRVLAFVSSLAVNLCLPFVNGVMLGFGEIFAKNVVMGWLGWKVPGSVSSNVGLKNSARESSRRTFKS